MTPSAFQKHDHAKCRKTALATAEAHCREQGLRLTPVRARVFELLLESHTALGAYDVLRRLVDEGFSAQPPVAYRALDFLVAQGLAHRIETLNAYVACAVPGETHVAAFVICKNCRTVGETIEPNAGKALAEAAERMGVGDVHSVIETAGVCSACQAREGSG